jgi:hypothetical protein
MITHLSTVKRAAVECSGTITRALVRQKRMASSILRSAFQTCNSAERHEPSVYGLLPHSE